MTEWICRFWHGEVALARAYCEYTLGWGTLAHLVTTGMAYGLHVVGASLWLAAVMFFLASPYTALATVGVWRSADRYNGSLHWAHAARIGVLLWAIAATLL